MPRLVLGEILPVFVNTVTPDGMYPVQDCEKLQLPSQMKLSEKPNAFAGIFVPFLEFTWNVKDFQKEDDCHSQTISEITNCQYPA